MRLDFRGYLGLRYLSTQIQWQLEKPLECYQQAMPETLVDPRRPLRNRSNPTNPVFEDHSRAPMKSRPEVFYLVGCWWRQPPLWGRSFPHTVVRAGGIDGPGNRENGEDRKAFTEKFTFQADPWVGYNANIKTGTLSIPQTDGWRHIACISGDRIGLVYTSTIKIVAYPLGGMERAVYLGLKMYALPCSGKAKEP